MCILIHLMTLGKRTEFPDRRGIHKGQVISFPQITQIESESTAQEHGCLSSQVQMTVSTNDRASPA